MEILVAVNATRTERPHVVYIRRIFYIYFFFLSYLTAGSSL